MAYPLYQKQKKRNIDDTLSPEAGSTTSNFERFFVIEAVNKDKPVTSLSPFVIEKCLSAAIGTAGSVKKTRAGALIVEVTRPGQVTAIMKMNSLFQIPVTVSPHRSLNSCKGVVRSVDLIDLTEEEVLEGLSPQGVIAVSRIVTRKSGSPKRTPVLVLTFRGTAVPLHIYAGYTRLSVSVYIQNPMRCYNCFKFGHGKNACKRESVCCKCGQTGHCKESCTQDEKCINCQGPHDAMNPQCPKYLEEKAIAKIRSEQGLTYPDAKKVYTNLSMNTNNGISYATSVSASSASVASKRSTPILVSSETQTVCGSSCHTCLCSFAVTGKVIIPTKYKHHKANSSTNTCNENDIERIQNQKDINVKNVNKNALNKPRALSASPRRNLRSKPQEEGCVRMECSNMFAALVGMEERMKGEGGPRTAPPGKAPRQTPWHKIGYP